MSTTIEKTAAVEVEYDGKSYTCNGERMMYGGQLCYMFRTRNGLDTDMLLRSDLDPESEEEFLHVVKHPGQPMVEAENQEEPPGKTEELPAGEQKPEGGEQKPEGGEQTDKPLGK